MALVQLRQLNLCNYHWLSWNTIHGLSIGRNVVAAYYLLPNKRRETTYIEMLNEIRCLNNDHQNW